MNRKEINFRYVNLGEIAQNPDQWLQFSTFGFPNLWTSSTSLSKLKGGIKQQIQQSSMGAIKLGKGEEDAVVDEMKYVTTQTIVSY